MAKTLQELLPIHLLKKILILKSSEISRLDKITRSNTDADESKVNVLFSLYLLVENLYLNQFSS